MMKADRFLLYCELDHGMTGLEMGGLLEMKWLEAFESSLVLDFCLIKTYALAAN